MKKSELRQIIQEEIKAVLTEQRYADDIAQQIVDGNLDQGKTREELYDLIYNLVLDREKQVHDERKARIRTRNIVWGDEDFIPDVLGAISLRKNQKK